MNQNRTQTGLELANGVATHLIARDMMPLFEFPLQKTWRADVIALGKSGEIWIVEVKSSVRDFTNDKKWQNYVPFADLFFFAVPENFPREILPPEYGLILTDKYDAELVQFPQKTQKLAPARKKALTLQFARLAARRLSHQTSNAPERGA